MKQNHGHHVAKEPVDLHLPSLVDFSSGSDSRSLGHCLTALVVRFFPLTRLPFSAPYLQGSE